MKHNNLLIFLFVFLFVMSCSKIPSLDLTAPSVRIVSITSSGSLTITVKAEVEGNALSVQSCGFYCSGNISLADSESYYSRLTGNTFAADITLPQKNKTYYVCAYISNGNREICSEPIPVKDDGNESNVDSATKDLSSSESANCYIVSGLGKYKFRTVRGNLNESVGEVASCEVLWESFGTSTTPSVGDLVKNAEYSDGYITFETASTFCEGNAVIAAKDANGTILWSWHIWLTDQPQGQTYNNGADVMMDRNLGATSATPCDVGALGLLYQWGRKDPFLGSASIITATEAKSTISWPAPVESSANTGTIAFATANPTTFISPINYKDYDWYYSETDNTRWRSSKTVYDPCPVGWRVPDGGAGGVWSVAFSGSSSWSDGDDFNYGMDFSKTYKMLGSSGPIWYPASGCRVSISGSLRDVGSYGGYWSVSPDGKYAYYLYFFNSGYVYPAYSLFSRAYGRSVRCLQE